MMKLSKFSDLLKAHRNFKFERMIFEIVVAVIVIVVLLILKQFLVFLPARKAAVVEKVSDSISISKISRIFCFC